MIRFTTGALVKNSVDRKVILLPFAVVALTVMLASGCATDSGIVEKPHTKKTLTAKKPLRSMKSLTAPSYARSIAFEDKGKARSRGSKRAAPKFDSAFQARLSPEWKSSAFRNLTIDGFRYSFDTIQGYLEGRKEDSIFDLSENGTLLVALGSHFELELTFYPPDVEGHGKFKPFNLEIANQKGKIVHNESIENRMEVYSIAK